MNWTGSPALLDPPSLPSPSPHTLRAAAASTVSRLLYLTTARRAARPVEPSRRSHVPSTSSSTKDGRARHSRRRRCIHACSGVSVLYTVECTCRVHTVPACSRRRSRRNVNDRAAVRSLSHARFITLICSTGADEVASGRETCASHASKGSFGTRCLLFVSFQRDAA